MVASVGHAAAELVWVSMISATGDGFHLRLNGYPSVPIERLGPPFFIVFRTWIL
jgi:hypothetical protein